MKRMKTLLHHHVTFFGLLLGQKEKLTQILIHEMTKSYNLFLSFFFHYNFHSMYFFSFLFCLLSIFFFFSSSFCTLSFIFFLLWSIIHPINIKHQGKKMTIINFQRSNKHCKLTFSLLNFRKLNLLFFVY